MTRNANEVSSASRMGGGRMTCNANEVSSASRMGGGQ